MVSSGCWKARQFASRPMEKRSLLILRGRSRLSSPMVARSKSCQADCLAHPPVDLIEEDRGWDRRAAGAKVGLLREEHRMEGVSVRLVGKKMSSGLRVARVNRHLLPMVHPPGLGAYCTMTSPLAAGQGSGGVGSQGSGNRARDPPPETGLVASEQ